MDGLDGAARVSLARLRLSTATTTIVAAIASFLTLYALCRAYHAQPGPALLAAILAITLSRRPERLTWRRALLAPFVIAATALVATAAAWLLHASPVLGAGAFVAVMFVSIWLRNFGERAKSIGSYIAMPLVALLVVPARADAPGGPLVDVGLVICAGVVPLAFVTAIARLARALAIPVTAAEHFDLAESKRPPRSGLPVPTRMALQMAVALGAAFAVGFLVFPGHWGWTVLTAFIVCSGARGRGDAAYKGVLRLAGALAGTLGAAALARISLPNGPAEAALIFSVLFCGLWLRDVNYAYWAACMTLVLALLSRSGNVADFGVLDLRLVAILCGAICAVAATWFVYPIRTEAVIRRRLADALAALDTAVSATPPEAGRSHELAHFEHRMAELERVATPVRWHRRILARSTVAEHPADWIALAHEVERRARAFEPRGSAGARERGTVRRAIGVSRRAIANHGKPDAGDAIPVSVALEQLRDAFVR